MSVWINHYICFIVNKYIVYKDLFPVRNFVSSWYQYLSWVCLNWNAGYSADENGIFASGREWRLNTLSCNIYFKTRQYKCGQSGVSWQGKYWGENRRGRRLWRCLQYKRNTNVWWEASMKLRFGLNFAPRPIQPRYRRRSSAFTTSSTI